MSAAYRCDVVAVEGPRYLRPMRRAAFALTAIALGSGLAVGLVGALELRMRSQEADNGLVLNGLEPGRKYALDPAVVDELNPDGFHDDPWARDKAPGTLRVVLLGDSVAYGSGLPTSRVFPQQAEVLLADAAAPVEILNLSIYGYDVEQIAATARSKAWALDPDLVVYAWFTNDHIPSELLQVGEDDAPVFIGTALPEGLELPLGDTLLQLSPGSAMARRFLGAHVARHRAVHRRDREDAAFFDRHFDALVADAEAHGVPLVIYGLVPHVLADPDLTRCSATVGQGQAFCAAQLDRFERGWRDMAGKGVPFLPSLPWIRSGARRSYYRGGVTEDPHHPNAEGHLLFARGLADAVSRWMSGEDLRAVSPPPPREHRRRKRRSQSGAGSDEADGPSPSRASREQLDL